MIINPVIVLRVLQGVLAFIAMALGATVANDINTHHEQADQIDLTVPAGIVFFIFTAVFTLLVTVPYTIVVPRYFPSPVIAHPHAMLVAETTTAIFWLAGFAAVADLLRRRADLLCDEVGACAATRGSVVVGVFELRLTMQSLLFGITAFFAVSHVFLGGRFNASSKDPPEIKHPHVHRSWTGAERV